MKKPNKQPTHGGSRPGSGRKPKPYKTVTVSVRVHEDDEETVKKLLDPYKLKNRNKEK